MQIAEDNLVDGAVLLAIIEVVIVVVGNDLRT